VKESRAWISYKGLTGKPRRIIVVEVDPDHPVVPETIVSDADYPDPIVIVRDKPREPAAPGVDAAPDTSKE
jgi:hypothetical protein